MGDLSDWPFDIDPQLGLKVLACASILAEDLQGIDMDDLRGLMVERYRMTDEAAQDAIWDAIEASVIDTPVGCAP